MEGRINRKANTYVQRSSVVKRRGVMTIRDIYSFFMALIPVISIYSVPLAEIGFSTVFLGLFAPYALFRYLKKLRLKMLLPFLTFVVYVICRSFGDWVNIFLMCIVIIHVLGTVGDSININKMRTVIEKVAVIASVLVIIQTLLYYILNWRTSLLIQPIILSDLQYYFARKNAGFYRPCAFFLEPSHFTQYCSVALISTLFPVDDRHINMKRALLIAFGCLCTTSGMGIALCFGAFAFYFFKKNSETRIEMRILKIMGGLFVLAGVFAVMMQFSFFATAVQRVFGEVDGYNAIWGRTLFWDSTVGSLSGKAKWFGVGALQANTDTQGKYLTGLMEVLYYYGYVGLGFLILMFVRFCIQKEKSQFVICLSLVYCGLLLVANLFSFISLSFWVSIISSTIMRKQSMVSH